MVLFQARIPVALERHSEVLNSLRSIISGIRARPGCTSCHLYADIEDAAFVVLLEEWTDLHSFRQHVRSASFKVVLSALDCASDIPEVRCVTLAHNTGLAFLRRCWQGQPDAGWNRLRALE